uniref:Uncharacterized protein n=1 Tax=viral metagenome TaxID=1070528 RepID=A0A6M3L6B0_9ZZZZ
MATIISFTDLKPADVTLAIDIVQKIEALKGELAKIQTARSQADAIRSGQENDINTEINKLTVALRAIRQATVV